MLSLLSNPEVLNLLFAVGGAVIGYLSRRDHPVAGLLSRLAKEKEEDSLLSDLIEVIKKKRNITE